MDDEDAAVIADADAAWDEPGEDVPWEQVKAELGLPGSRRLPLARRIDLRKRRGHLQNRRSGNVDDLHLLDAVTCWFTAALDWPESVWDLPLFYKRRGKGVASGMSEYRITGPIESRRVIVDGRRVPFLEAALMPGGKISLLLDGRYGLDVPVADADAFIPWIADAIAVALGYNCHPRAGTEPVRSDPFPPAHAISWIKTAPAGPGVPG